MQVDCVIFADRFDKMEMMPPPPPKAPAKDAFVAPLPKMPEPKQAVEQQEPIKAPLPTPPPSIAATPESDEAPPPLLYAPPPWSAKPKYPYALEVLKTGQSLGVQDIHEKPFYLVGRHGLICDIVLEHQTISRQHAVIQHRADGNCLFPPFSFAHPSILGQVTVFDLESSHGTFLNKIQIPPRKHIVVRNGDFLRFGQVSR